MNTLRIEQLTIYPVKSLRGIHVEQWPITPQGLQYDRHWMLVMPNGRFVSQRQLPRMALIDTAIERESLILSADGHSSIALPLLSPVEQSAFRATIWRDECDVIEATTEASSWLNSVLKAPQPLRLVTMANDHLRVQSQPERFGEQTYTQFADAAPFLLANQASLQALNHRLSEKGLTEVDMRRFRPNVVVSGLEAFEEHNTNTLTHANGLALRLCDHCERCIMTTIDPDTGNKDAEMEPYKTLIKLNPMPKKPKAPGFAVNAILNEAKSGIWRVGEELSTS